MSVNEQDDKNLGNMPTVLTSGAEPTELLLQLVWSPTETLMKRGKAKLFVGNGAVAIVLIDVTYDPLIGIVPTVKESVGNP